MFVKNLSCHWTFHVLISHMIPYFCFQRCREVPPKHMQAVDLSAFQPFSSLQVLVELRDHRSTNFDLLVVQSRVCIGAGHKG